MGKVIDEKEIMEELRSLTKRKDKWQTSIEDIAIMLNGIYSSKIKAKVLWLLGEIGLKYPLQVQFHIDKIAFFGG
jgi:hypothetical protein